LAIAKNTAARATKGNFNFHPYVAREPQSPLLPVYAPIAPLISTNMSMLLKAMVDTETRAEERVSRTTLYVDSFIAMFAGMLLGAALQRTRGERDRRRHRPQRETILELQARRD
jgi:hypothetical protein